MPVEVEGDKDVAWKYLGKRTDELGSPHGLLEKAGRKSAKTLALEMFGSPGLLAWLRLCHIPLLVQRIGPFSV
jgi:hypothetical protein